MKRGKSIWKNKHKNWPCLLWLGDKRNKTFLHEYFFSVFLILLFQNLFILASSPGSFSFPIVLIDFFHRYLNCLEAKALETRKTNFLHLVKADLIWPIRDYISIFLTSEKDSCCVKLSLFFCVKRAFISIIWNFWVELQWTR